MAKVSAKESNIVIRNIKNKQVATTYQYDDDGNIIKDSAYSINLNNTTATEGKKLKALTSSYPQYTSSAVDDTVSYQDGGAAASVEGQEATVNHNGNGIDFSPTLDTSPDANYFTPLLHSYNRFTPSELDPFNKRFRLGYLDPYRTVSTAREYLFFTKPDLNIYDHDKNESVLLEYLRTQTFWTELTKAHPNVIRMLELSLDRSDPFNNLLGNTVMNNLEIPSIEAEMIDTPSNMYGVSYTYRGTSESSDNNPTFSLEFRDTKYLPVYNFFRAYEDYEVLKHHGHIPPGKYYIRNHVLNDQYAIYKFIVGEDGETILYYGKFYGVKSKSLPRDVFSNTDFTNGLSYSIDFGAAFYEDMKPYLLAEFNNLYANKWNTSTYLYDVYNPYLDAADNRPATAARVFRVASSSSPCGYVYKLKWKGNDRT